MSRERLLDEKRHVSGKMSEICRFIGFGFLIYYTIHPNEFDLGIVGALIILFDYLQYLFGLLSVDKALESNEFSYDHYTYKGRETMFWLKQMMVVLGCIFYFI